MRAPASRPDRPGRPEQQAQVTEPDLMRPPHPHVWGLSAGCAAGPTAITAGTGDLITNLSVCVPRGSR